jgi:linoleoyl-CoA desaturase
MLKEFIYIHSKFYDLDSLKKSHPGGYLKIFECIGREKDCTALFESSHCMKDIKNIYELMKSYEIQPENYAEFAITEDLIEEKKQQQKFNFDNYHELANEIKQEFKIEKNYKVNNFWYLKLSVILILYVICYYKGLIKNENHRTLFYENFLYAFLAGILWINIAFCIMHDASHYGLFNTKEKFNNEKNKRQINFNFFLETLSELFNYNLAIGGKNLQKITKKENEVENSIKKDNNLINNTDINDDFSNDKKSKTSSNDKIVNNKKKYLFGFLQKSDNIINKNDILNSICQGWSLWNSQIWFKHHTYAHHSFTGLFGLDPDLIHLRPLARKTKSDNKVVKFLISIQQKTIWLILIFFPGMFLGQIIAYFVGAVRGFIWKVSVPQVLRKTPFLELLLYSASALVLIFNKNFICVYFYFLGLNIMYAICIVPDHDMFESTVENEKQTDDWCEMQILRSGNFCEENFFITEFNGGINFQIQHHLFPTIAHCHYEKIAGKVKEFSLRKGFQYVCKKSLSDVYDSYMKTISYAADSNHDDAI